VNDSTKEALNTIFDVEPVTPSTSAEIIPAVEILPAPISSAPPDESEAEKLAREDFEFSRGALKSVATESQNTLHRAVDVANQTDTPRSFEAVGDLVRATLEAHRELQGLHKTAAEIRLATKTAQTPASQVNIQQGVVFQGSSEELLRLISKDRQ
jgi:hypothetical protein